MSNTGNGIGNGNGNVSGNGNYLNQTNFINFINHLLTFNKQHELYTIQNKKNNINNSNNINNTNKNINLNTGESLPFRFNINSKVIIKLCDIVLSIFRNESNVLYLDAPLYVFGDIHGQFSDLIHFLEMTGLPPNNKFLFLGDYVDRGNNSIEVCCLLFALKIMYPGNIYLLRGNHECPVVNQMYGLLDECETRFGADLGTDNSNNGIGRMVFDKINEVLCALPLAAIINKKIFCVHGGISPHLNKISDIDNINRFINIPDDGLICDLMWSDPAIMNNLWGNNSRGISCTYNPQAINNFLKNNKLQLICRAHQLVSEGYKFFGNNKLITVFSAPNYCGNCGNNGAVMKINENLVCSFIIIKPTNKDSQTINNSTI